MKKRLISFITSLLFVFNCVYPILSVSAENEENLGKLIFKYYDLEGNNIPEGENLKVDNIYELQISFENMQHLFGASIPIHFNNEIVKAVSSDTHEVIENDIIGDDVLNTYKALVLSKNASGEWQPEIDKSLYEVLLVSNNKGLITADVIAKGMQAKNLNDETKIFSVYFTVLKSGNPDIRIATLELDGADNSSEMYPNGAEFSYSNGSDVGAIEYDTYIENKLAVSSVSGVAITKDNGDEIADNEVPEVQMGESIQLRAKVMPEDAYNKNVTWASQDNSIATVDENGLVSGIAEGETKITVTTEEGGYIDSCTVKVINENIPTVPQNLTVVSQTGKSVEFKWSESTAKNGVTGYKVYRNGTEIADVTDGCSYVDEDKELVTGEEYSYTVVAYYTDENGETLSSQQSDKLTVTLLKPEIDSVVPEQNAVIAATQQQNCYVYYKDTNNSDGAVITVEYKNADNEWQAIAVEAKQGKNTAKGLNYFTFALEPSNIGEGNVRYTVADKMGCSDSVEVKYVLVQPPAAVTDFLGTPATNAIILSWYPSESAYVTQYVMYRKLHSSSSWMKYKTIADRESTYYIDETVGLNKSYDYYIVAVDKFGQISEKAEVFAVSPKPDEEPPVVMSISPNDGSVISGKTIISASIYDSVGIQAVLLQYRTDSANEWEALSEYRETSDMNVSFDIDTTTLNAEKIQIRVIAWDVDGYESDGLPERTYTIDNTPPKAVDCVTGNADSATQITLIWNDYVPDDDFYYFTVEEKTEDGTYKQIGEKIYDVKGMQIKGLSPATEYTYRVFAYDKAGNRSEPSTDCIVGTLADEAAPVVTKIMPNPQRINKDLDMTFTVSDNCGVDYIQVQTSYDGKTDWKNAGEVIYASSKDEKVIFNYTLTIAEHPDGDIYVRAIPYDIYGNGGLSDNTAPYNQYIIDRTPPAVPSNVKAEGCDGYIEISWDAATEEDFAGYRLARSTKKDTGYSVIATNYTSRNYFDTSIDDDIIYYYKVCVIDKTGNVSDYSEPVYAQKAEDKTNPEIQGLLPSNGARINSSAKVTVYAYDNNNLKTVVLQYSTDGKTWTDVGEKSDEISSFPLTDLKLQEGIYKFRAYAIDANSNRSEYSDVYEYTIDDTAPIIKDVEAEGKEECIDLIWSCEDDDDLNGITVYYKAVGNSSYKKASTRAVTEDNNYSCTIEGLSGGEYTIKLVAVDKAGNESEYVTENISVTAAPVAVVLPEIEISVQSAMVVGVENIFRVTQTKGTYNIQTYEWSFGDGNTSDVKEATHKYTETGTYLVTCTVKDTAGNVATAEKKITVTEKDEAAALKINIADDSGNIVENCDVMFDVTGENQKYSSDSNGTLTIMAKPGIYTIGFYKEGYLPTQKTVNMVKNATIELTVRIVKKSIVIGSLTWTRMDLKEIEAAGIDTTDPANQNMYKYEMTIYIGEEKISFGGHKSIDDDEPIVITDKDFTSNKKFTDSTGKHVNNTIYVFDFNDKANGYEYSEDDEFEVPRNVVAYVQTPGEISWLKEYFDVQLSIFNRAENDFWIKDCVAQLNYPTSGLTLISDSAEVEMGTIEGQHSAEAKWILRGDVAGEYNISADFSGELGSVINNVFTSWDYPINATFVNDRPIKVYGSDGLSMVVEYENRVSDTDDYMFRIGLKNRSVLTRYMPSVILNEDDIIKNVDSYNNYKELLTGIRLPSTEGTVAYGETVYSNFTVDGLESTDGISGYIVKRLRESTVKLPVEYREVEPLSFHSRKIDVYTIDENGDEIKSDAKSLSAYPGTVIKLGVHITELLPGAEDYTDCAGIKVYLNNEEIGTTDEKGILKLDYQVSGEKNTNKKLVFKGNRTKETSIQVQILDDSVTVNGYVYDIYGNSVKDALVQVGNESVYTNSDGSFEITGLKAGAMTVTVSKDKFKTITQDINPAPGTVTLIYNLERTKVKPKIVSAKFENLGEAGQNIIVPAGLQMSDKLIVETAVTEEAEEFTYRLEAVNSDDEIRAISFENNTVVLSSLNAGETLRVIAIASDGTESEPYVIPITVKEAPFVHLLNSVNADVKYGQINSRILFAGLFEKMKDKQGNSAYWLSGTALDKWNELFDKFASSFTIDITGNKLESGTDLVIDWFAYKGFNIYVNYDFETGELSISPNSVGRKYDIDYYSDRYREMLTVEQSNVGKRTGYFGVSEVIEEDVRKATGYRYSSLMALNNLKWDVESMFDVKFTFDNDSWNGEFELSVDEENRFYGYYARKLSFWEKIGPWYMPEYLAGTWYKSMTADNNIRVPLSGDSSNSDEFSIEYNTNTNGGWYTGIGSIVLSSQSANKISLYPTPQLTGHTHLRGGYYILGYWYSFFVGESVSSRYTLSRNEDMARTMSILQTGELPAEAELEPVAMMTAEEAGEVPDALENGVFANAEISVSDSDNPVMVYLKTDESRENPADGAMLAMRKYDGNAWSEPVKMQEYDSTGDFNPAVANTKNGTVVVWADMARQNTIAAGSLTVDNIEKDIASQLGISAAVFDGEKWSDKYSLKNTKTENGEEPKSCLNYSPVVSALGDGAIAAWIENTDNEMTAQVRNDSIKYSVYDGTGWTEPAYLQRKGTISDLKIAQENGTVYLVYAVTDKNTYEYTEENSTVSQEETLKKFYMVSYNGNEWSAEKTLNTSIMPDEFAEFVVVNTLDEERSTEDNKVYEPQLTLVTVSGNTMYTYVAATREILEKKTADDSLASANEFTTAYNDENAALVWITSQDDGQRIYTALYDTEKQTWSNPVEAKAISSDYVAKNINAVFDDSIKLVYNLYEYESNDGSQKSVSLCAAEQTLDCDLEIEKIELADNAVVSNHDTTFRVKLNNKGLNTVNNCKLTLKTNTGAESNFDLAASIDGGASSEQEIVFNLGEFGDNLNSIKITAEVTSENDLNTNNNTAECDITLANTEIAGIECTPSDENKLLVSVKIKNNGMVNVTRNIYLYKNNEQAAEPVQINVKSGEVQYAKFELENPEDVIELKAKIDLSKVGEISDNNKEKIVAFTPNSMHIVGIITPVSGNQDNIKAKSVDVVTIQNGEETYDLSTDTENFSWMIPVETDKVEISAPGMLSREVDIELIKDNLNPSKLKLFVGDVVPDSGINARDLSAMLKRFWSAKGNDDYDGVFDFDDDGIIEADLDILIANYGKGKRHYQEMDKELQNNN